MKDEITSGTLMCRDGEVVHPVVRQILGIGTGGRAARGAALPFLTYARYAP
jgi:hypothetical protein